MACKRNVGLVGKGEIRIEGKGETRMEESITLGEMLADSLAIDPSVPLSTGASIRQEHHNDGQVDVYFRAVLNAPTKGEGGLLTVSDASGRWTGSTEVKIDKEGEAFAEVKVS